MAKAENNKIDSDLNKSVSCALEYLKCGDFAQASSLFSYILRVRYDSEIAEFGIASCKYWMSREDKIRKVSEGMEQGSYLLQQWQKFEDFSQKHKRANEQVIDAIMFFVYSRALEQLNKDVSAKKNNNLNLIFLSGIAYKKIGDFQNALICFERYLSLNSANCNALVQLADTYMLLDKVNESKVLFREAFSMHPETIDLDKIDCSMMRKLIDRVAKTEASCDETLLKYWIAVYGWLDGVLNIYREMSIGEVSKLGREINILERDLDLSVSYNAMLVAKLMNKYLWLYDYYSLQKVNNDKLLDIEKKMKKISYNLYTIFKQSNQETK